MIHNNYLLSETGQNLEKTETKNESHVEAENTKRDFQNGTSSCEKARVNDESALAIMTIMDYPPSNSL